MSKQPSSESAEYELWTRREYLEDVGGTTAVALPLSHRASDDDGFLSGLFSRDPDLVVTDADGNVITEDPDELRFDGSAVTGIEEVGHPDDTIVRVTLQGGSGGVSLWSETDAGELAPAENEPVLVDTIGPNQDAATKLSGNVNAQGNNLSNIGVADADEFNNTVSVDPSDHGDDLGAALNAARSNGHFAPDTLLDVAPGQWLVSTPVDWTAHGAANAPKGPSVNFDGVHIDPDVGAGNHCFERIGVKMMRCYGGHVEQVNGSGCETVLLDGRDNAGARPRLNLWFGLTINDPGAGTSAYHNVGAPRMHFAAPTFICASGEAMCLYGSNNEDGLTATHTTLNGSPADAVQCSFSDPDFSMHGTGGRAVVRTGGQLNGLTFSGTVYYQSNQDAIPGHQFIGQGSVHDRITWGNVTMEHLGTGFAPFFEVVAGHTSNIERLSFDVLSGNLDTTQTDGKVYDDKEGTTLVGFNCPQLSAPDGLRARSTGSVVRDVWIDGREVRANSGVTIDAAEASSYRIYGHGYSSQSIGTDGGGWLFTTGAHLQVARVGQLIEIDPLDWAINFGTNGSRIQYNSTNGDMEIYADDGTQQL